MPELIRDHVWRAPPANTTDRGSAPRLERPCEYLTCGRPLAEHALPAVGQHCPCPVLDMEEAFDALCLCDHASSKHANGTGACTAVLT